MTREMPWRVRREAAERREAAKRQESANSQTSSKAIGDRIGLISTIGTAITAIAAGLKYVFGAFTPIALEITLPPIIEFRCSDPYFRPKLCLSRPEDRWHVTASAALHLRAVGDPSKEATITHATATVRSRATQSSFELNWLWSSNLVPTSDLSNEPEGKRTQVTGTSIKGGETKSQEMWFFPMDAECGNLAPNRCPEQRKNFVEWVSFLRQVATTDRSRPASETAYEVEFKFKYREGDQSAELPITCVVEVTDTMQNMADFVRHSREGILYVSAPCRSSREAGTVARRWFDPIVQLSQAITGRAAKK